MKAHYLLPLALLVAPQAFAGGYTHADVCKGLIALEQGHELERLRITHSGESPEIMYIHKQSRERTRYRCQFPAPGRVAMATYLDDKKTGARWRDDASASFVQEGTHLKLKTAKGREREFATRDFRQ